MTRKEKWNVTFSFLCALIWAGVGCAWFVRAYRGAIGTPWFNVVLGLACLATGGLYACRGVRDSLNTNRNSKK